MRVAQDPSKVDEVQAAEASARSSLSAKQKAHLVSQYDIYFMGITFVLGGQFINWNKGLGAGFWEFFIALVLMCCGYLSLTLCLGEMTSILPFAGGSYGYVRCSLGPLLGYLVGFSESIAYVLYVAAAVVSIGTLFRDLFNSSATVEPAYWLIFYSIAVLLQAKGGAWMWGLSSLLSGLALLIVLIYCLANLHHVNLTRYPENRTFGKHGFDSFYHHLPLAAWFFKGIEPLTLITCNNLKQTADTGTNDMATAGKIVPRVMLVVMITMMVTAFSILLTSCSVSPGSALLPLQMHPLDPGMDQAFHLSHQLGTLFMFPATLASAYGFTFAFSQQLNSMASSGLLPAYLKIIGPCGTPFNALLTGSLASFLVALLAYYTVEEVADMLFGIAMLGSCAVNTSLFLAFWMYRDHYSSLERSFVNPLGKPSAVVGLLMFAFMGSSLAFNHRDHYTALITYSILMTAGLVYYLVVAERTQFFSQEEQKKLLKIYVLNANHNRHHNKPLAARILSALGIASKHKVSTSHGHGASHGVLRSASQGTMQVQRNSTAVLPSPSLCGEGTP